MRGQFRRRARWELVLLQNRHERQNKKQTSMQTTISRARSWNIALLNVLVRFDEFIDVRAHNKKKQKRCTSIMYLYFLTVEITKKGHLRILEPTYLQCWQTLAAAIKSTVQPNLVNREKMVVHISIGSMFTTEFPEI